MVDIRLGMVVRFESPYKSGYLLVTWANESVVHGYYIVRGDDATYPCIATFEVVNREYITEVYETESVWGILNENELRALVFNREAGRPRKVWERTDPIHTLTDELQNCRDLFNRMLQFGYTSDVLKDRIRAIDLVLEDSKK